MFLMRRAKIEDVPTLLKLARMVHFINLPADRDIIADKVQWSRTCFAELARRRKRDGTLTPERATGGAGAHAETRSDAQLSGSRTSAGGSGLADLTGRSKVFMFSLEDRESRGVLGTSQIITSMGGPGHPNLSFELSRKEMFSNSLQVGTTHMVAKLKLDESGPTEIGGLILQPSYRGHKARLGRFLSLVRFHFMGLYRPVVADRVIAEMMGPITPDGQNTLWEYLGRRFINLSYPEADRFCQYSKEFMLSLLPREEIYLTLLPPEARRIIAQVGPETEPARRMLEQLGFSYKNCIDPFDGGPTLEAHTDDITIVKATRRIKVGEALAQSVEGSTHAMVSRLDANGEFVAIQSACELDSSDTLRLSREDLAALEVDSGDLVGFSPLVDSGRKHRQSALTISNGHTKPTKNKGSKPGKLGAGVGSRRATKRGTQS